MGLEQIIKLLAEINFAIFLLIFVMIMIRGKVIIIRYIWISLVIYYQQLFIAFSLLPSYAKTGRIAMDEVILLVLMAMTTMIVIRDLLIPKRHYVLFGMDEEHAMLIIADYLNEKGIPFVESDRGVALEESPEEEYLHSIFAIGAGTFWQECKRARTIGTSSKIFQLIVNSVRDTGLNWRSRLLLGLGMVISVLVLWMYLR
jgi:hypothetical protein